MLFLGYYILFESSAGLTNQGWYWLASYKQDRSWNGIINKFVWQSVAQFQSPSADKERTPAGFGAQHAIILNWTSDRNQMQRPWADTLPRMTN